MSLAKAALRFSNSVCFRALQGTPCKSEARVCALQAFHTLKEGFYTPRLYI